MVAGLLLFLAARPYLPDNRRRAKDEPREKMGPGDWPRVFALILLVPAMAISLLTNQEIFNAYLVWADQQFQLTFFGMTLPTSWMITIDAALSFSMLVAVAAFWKWRSVRTGSEPDELGKMIIGSFFTIAGGLCLYMAALTQGSAKIGLAWPLMFHLLNSIGFAHILPVSLSAILENRAAGDQRDGDRNLLSGLLPRQQDRRLCRRMVQFDADNHLLADPRRQRGSRPPRVHRLQGDDREANDLRAGSCTGLTRSHPSGTHDRNSG